MATTIDGRGTVDTSSGTGLTVSVASTFQNVVTMSYMPTSTAQSLAASGTAAYPGVYTLNNATPAGYYLPDPSTVPGGYFSFRTLGAASQQHFLTASASTFGKFLTDGTSNGSKVTLAGVVGSSITLVSDGLNFCVMAKSGSLSFTGT